MSTETTPHFRVKAMCLFVHHGKTLVSPGFDTVKNKSYLRVLGGSMNFFESSEDGIRREIREELNSEIENLRRVSVVENRFTYLGQQGHEIVFLFRGDLARRELYDQETIRIVEPWGEFTAEWVPISDITKGSIPLYPEFDYASSLED